MRNTDYSIVVVQGRLSGITFQLAPILPTVADGTIERLRHDKFLRVLYRVNVKGGVYG